MTKFERPTSDEGELVLRVYRNNSGETIPLGGAVVHDYSSGNLGLVTKPTAVLLSLFAGIARAPVVNGALGVFLVSGPVSALVLNQTATDLAVGDLLVPVTGQWYLLRSGAGDGLRGLALAAQAYAQSNPAVQALKWVHIRAS
jgi:hypothetical protein